MKQTILKALALLLTMFGSPLFTGVAFPLTEVTGKVLEDTKWSAAQSPYLLSGDITVEKGVTLTLERDVVIVFSKRARFWVQGRLDAYRAFFNGFYAADNQEVFQFSSGSHGSLVRCAFLDLSLVFDSANVRLYASVVSNRNGTGVTIGEDVSPTVSDTSFHGNSYFAVYNLGKTPCKLVNCFWGAENGPSGVGDGTGDAVGPNILFTPFQPEETIRFLTLYEIGVQTGLENSVDGLLLSYHLVNMNTTAYKAVLGASLIGPGGERYQHPESDIYTTVPPGFHRYQRLFKIPPHAGEGHYDIHCGVMNENLSAYHAYARLTDGMRIQGAHLFTSKKNIPFPNPGG